MLYPVTLVLALGAIASPEEAKQDLPDLAAVIAKLEEAGSYTFEMRTESPSGRGGSTTTTNVTGRVAEDRPLHLSTDSTEIYRKGRKSVVRGKDGEFEPLARPDFSRGPRGGGAGNRRPAGGNTGQGQEPRRSGGAPGIDAPNEDFTKMRERMQVLNVARTETPLDLLKRIPTESLETTVEGTTVTFRGTLPSNRRNDRDASGNRGSGRGDAGGARRAGGSGASGGRSSGGGGADRGSRTETTTVEVTAKTDGSVDSILVTSTWSFGSGERARKRTTRKTIRLRDIGRTSFDVPESAADRLSR